MSDDLATWLTQVLDEDEDRARAAIADDGGQDGGFEDSFDQLTGGKERGGPLAFVPSFGEAAAAMIVWQTPRRALARIAADRQILIEHREVGSAVYGGPTVERWRYCETCQRADEDVELVWPCRTVKLLASAYADRPGYCEEWKLDA